MPWNLKYHTFLTFIQVKKDKKYAKFCTSLLIFFLPLEHSAVRQTKAKTFLWAWGQRTLSNCDFWQDDKWGASWMCGKVLKSIFQIHNSAFSCMWAKKYVWFWILTCFKMYKTQHCMQNFFDLVSIELHFLKVV